MTDRELLLKLKDKLHHSPSNYQVASDLFEMARIMEEQDLNLARQTNLYLRNMIPLQVKDDTNSVKKQVDFYKLNKKCLFFDGHRDFDAFLQYLEYERNPEKRFYLPRRKSLFPIVQAFQELHEGRYDLLTVSQPKRTGKALPLYTKVLTPTGFTLLGDLKVGDKVISDTGKPVKVTGVFPQGRKEIYEMTFTETGKCPTKTIVECCKDHLWAVRTEKDRAKNTTRVMSCGDIMNGTMKRGKNRHNNISVDYILPTEYENKGKLLLRPYLMGQLVGGGSFRGGVKITTSDNEVVERIRGELPQGDKLVHIRNCDYGVVKKEDQRDKKGYRIKNATTRILEHYGLMGKMAYEKHIPEDYLYASVEDRLELIRGLFDSDGYISKTHMEFNTTSKQLEEDVSFLIKGLGGRVRITERRGSYTKEGKIITTRPNYRIYCQFPSGINPFWVKRKATTYNNKRERLYRFISEIRPTGRFTEMICISVEDGMFVIGDEMIPTHNTTLGLLFVLFRAGNAPDGSSFCAGTGAPLAKSFYNGCLQVLLSPQEYLYFDIFPNAKVASTNSDENAINLAEKSRFATITCKSIDAKFVGSTEATAEGVLYLDDLVDGEKEAINHNTLDKIWDTVAGDVIGRALEWVPIVMQGTRYSVNDPIGRAQIKYREMGKRVKVIEIPALDPITDESNFEFIREGRPTFTTEYFRSQRILVSPTQWASQFQQEPYEAKGRLFPEDDLNRYFELPVENDPDAIIAACDTAEGGGDSVCMPVGYIYGEDVFIHDVVFDNSTPAVTKPQCVNTIIRNMVSTATFESNNAGQYYARDVEEGLKEQGYRASIRTKRAISKKTTRIENASDGILKHFYFKDRSLYSPQSQYGLFIRELTTYTRTGKNAHDDAPDALALLENVIREQLGTHIRVFDRPI